MSSNAPPAKHLDYLLTAYLFENLSAAGRTEVESHLAQCPACRTELEMLRSVLGLAELSLDHGGKTYVFEEHRRQRVLEAAKNAPNGFWGRAVATSRKWSWKLGAVAALLMVMVLVIAPNFLRSRMSASYEVEKSVRYSDSVRGESLAKNSKIQYERWDNAAGAPVGNLSTPPPLVFPPSEFPDFPKPSADGTKSSRIGSSTSAPASPPPPPVNAPVAALDLPGSTTLKYRAAGSPNEPEFFDSSSNGAGAVARANKTAKQGYVKQQLDEPAAQPAPEAAFAGKPITNNAFAPATPSATPKPVVKNPYGTYIDPEIEPRARRSVDKAPSESIDRLEESLKRDEREKLGDRPGLAVVEKVERAKDATRDDLSVAPGGAGWGGGNGPGTGKDAGNGLGSFGNASDAGRKLMEKRKTLESDVAQKAAEPLPAPKRRMGEAEIDGDEAPAVMKRVETISPAKKNEIALKEMAEQKPAEMPRQLADREKKEAQSAGQWGQTGGGTEYNIPAITTVAPIGGTAPYTAQLQSELGRADGVFLGTVQPAQISRNFIGGGKDAFDSAPAHAGEKEVESRTYDPFQILQQQRDGKARGATALSFDAAGNKSPEKPIAFGGDNSKRESKEDDAKNRQWNWHGKKDEKGKGVEQESEQRATEQLRRAHLDTTGEIPAAEEVAKFSQESLAKKQAGAFLAFPQQPDGANFGSHMSGTFTPSQYQFGLTSDDQTQLGLNGKRAEAQKPSEHLDTFGASFNGDLDNDTTKGNGREQVKTPSAKKENPTYLLNLDQANVAGNISKDSSSTIQLIGENTFSGATDINNIKLGEIITRGNIKTKDKVLIRQSEITPDIEQTQDELTLRGYRALRAENPKLTFRDFLRHPDVAHPVPLTDEGMDEDDYVTKYGTRPFVDCARDHLSTFGMDVDTAAYTLARSALRAEKLPPPESVRTEEFVNYFKQPYRVQGDEAFGVFAESAQSPFVDTNVRARDAALLGAENVHTRELLKIGIKSREARPNERKPAMLTFVVDTSGSMSRALSKDNAASRLSLVKEALTNLVESLTPDDAVGIIGFNDQAELILPRTQARHKQRILDAIDSMSPGGSTNVEAGLNMGYRMADEAYATNAVNRMILFSDGVANIGEKGPADMLKLVTLFAQRGVDLSTVGIGMSGIADPMMRTLADAGNGSCHAADTLNEANKILLEKLPPHLNVLARDAKVQVDFNVDTVKSYRLLGYEKRKIADKDFRNDKIDSGDVGHDTLVTVFYEIERQNGVHGSLGKVYLRWKDAGSPRLEVVERNYPLEESTYAGPAQNASPDFRFLACVARFAELLRESKWVRHGSYAEVLAELQKLPNDFKVKPECAEVIDLVQRAQRLSIAKWKSELK